MNASSRVRPRFVIVVAIHAMLVAAAWYGAWFLRLDELFYDMKASKGVDYLRRCTDLLGVLVLAVRMFFFWKFDLFQGLWRYVSITDLINLAKATICGSLLFAMLLFLGSIVSGDTEVGFFQFRNVPRLALVIEAILCVVMVGGVRLSTRVYRELFAPAPRGGRSVVIVGAGDAGEMVLREMRTHKHMGYDPVAFVDDDTRKWGSKIHGVPVVGGTNDLRDVVDRFDAEEVMMAIRTAPGALFRKVLDQCTEAGVRMRRLPGAMSDIVRLTQIRDVAVEDLLDRDTAPIDIEGLRAALQGRTVLVTGAGGSIGSEVVRQLCGLSPKQVVALDRNENQLFFLERELSVRFPEQRTLIRIGDCQDRAGMRALFKQTNPDVVIHAAAFKHVPLMEAHPVEAVRNNVQASLELAKLSIEYGVKKFLLISSDKAVRPTSVMGATKRGCELALLSLDPSETEFMAVRFGNVLGSQGSVIPLFKRQIQEGGPITVTHPDVVRYFMTIGEAVSLVLQAGLLGSGGKVYHLDMGKPVRVMDLAENLIRLSGFRPRDDIEIRIIGLRPGEKMHEELLIDGENVIETSHERIRVLASTDVDREAVRGRVEDLLAAASHGRRAVITALKRLVPEYDPNNDEFRRVLAENNRNSPRQRQA